jgi:gas vesicle protein
MSEHSVILEQEFGGGNPDPPDPVIANLQQSTNLANENCDRVLALAQTLSAQLRKAQDRINQLEREAEGLGDQLLAEAKAIIEEVRSSADERVNRTKREADERIDRLKADAETQIGRLQNELAQATRGIEQGKDEAATRIENVKIEADARVDAVETEAKKRVDVIRRENEDKVLRLEATLTEAKDRADRAEQWLNLIRHEIEDHLMPAMRDGPKPPNSAARPRSLTLPTLSRSSASTWFRRLWLRLTSTAALGCRVRADIESAATFDRALQHESGVSNGLSVRKTSNTSTASEPSASLPSGGNSAVLSSVTAG